MPRGLRSRLVAAFVLAIACFVASTLYSVHLSRRIDERARVIVQDVTPSIERLADTRGSLRDLEAAVVRFELARSDEARAEASRARTEVDEAFERHLARPAGYPGEQARWAEIHRALAEVDRTIAGVLAGGAGAPPDRDVHAAIGAAAEAVRGAIDDDVGHARELALEIEDARRWATRVALLLDLASAAFTVLAALIALRALAQHEHVVAERNALLARRAEELEEFAGRVAHDIVGPLSATRLSLESIAARVGEAGAASVERAKRGVDRVTGIVDGLLRFARAGARPEPGVITAVAPVMRDVVHGLEPIARDAGIALELGDLPACRVAAHPGVLASVVENLIRNAIKYMGSRPRRRIDVRAAAADGRLRIEVEDTGPGIDAEIVDTIFDPHVRGRDRAKPGIGLGLATVRRIADAHGGTCGVTSRVGEGSRFWVELPLLDQDPFDLEPPATVRDRNG